MPMPRRRNSGKVASTLTYHEPGAFASSNTRGRTSGGISSKAAEIVGIVEAVADEASGDLAIDLGDNGVAVGEAASLTCGALAPDLEDRLPGSFQRAPQIRRQAFAGDVDEHG